MRKVGSCLAIIIVISFFYLNNTFYKLEHYFSDQLIKEEKPVMSNIKILAIDEESLEKIGKWPWPRDIMADMVDALAQAGAQAVFVDVLYSEVSQNLNEDKRLQEVIKAHDNIYLAAQMVFNNKAVQAKEGIIKKVNYPAITIPQNQIGIVNASQDRDGVVRDIRLGIPDENGEIIPAISVRLANLLLDEKDKEITWSNQSEWFYGNETLPTSNNSKLRFTYSTSPVQDAEEEISNKFDTYSIHRVINGEIPPLYFENTIVMIGPYAEGLQDKYMTPMSQHVGMYGIEIHSNIVQSLYEGDFYSKASQATGLMLIVFLTTASFLLIDWLKAKWGFLLFIVFVASYTLGARVIFETNQLLLPLTYINLALIIVYITSVVSQYIVERKEKSRVTNLFGRYVSKGVVDEILASNDEVKLGGVRKEVTLLFVDIRGFTPLSEKMEPEEVIVILNEYLDLATKAVFEHDGTLDKFMGDGVMSIFGAPIEQEDHAERAVRAALYMKAHADKLSQKLQEKYGRTVRFGVGVNSGPAVIGNIGSHDRLDYTAIGDTVNLAARLESNAKPDQILISESTYDIVKDTFKCLELEPIKVKGKEKHVQVYEVKEELQK